MEWRERFRGSRAALLTTLFSSYSVHLMETALGYVNQYCKLRTASILIILLGTFPIVRNFTLSAPGSYQLKISAVDIYKLTAEVEINYKSMCCAVAFSFILCFLMQSQS